MQFVPMIDTTSASPTLYGADENVWERMTDDCSGWQVECVRGLKLLRRAPESADFVYAKQLVLEETA